jgi:hypothetical protein
VSATRAGITADDVSGINPVIRAKVESGFFGTRNPATEKNAGRNISPPVEVKRFRHLGDTKTT